MKSVWNTSRTSSQRNSGSVVTFAAYAHHGEALRRPLERDVRGAPATALAIVRGRRRLGFEFKRTDAPKLTSSMASALEALELDRIDVVHAGSETYPMHPKVRALAISSLLRAFEPMR
jgi:hypothetical protein